MVPDALAPLRVLACGRCPEALQLLRSLLGRWGLDYCVAASVPEAMTVARSCRPDVVLLDVTAAGARDVARALREMSPRPLLVALAGDGDTADCASGIFDLSISRPLEVNALRAALQRSARNKPEQGSPVLSWPRGSGC
jgi:CheY-like chemotaxis protein